MSVIGTDGYVSISTSVDVELESTTQGERDYGWFCIPLAEIDKFYDYAKGLKDLKTRPGWVKLQVGLALETKDNLDGAENTYPIVLDIRPDNRFVAFFRRVFEHEEYMERCDNVPVAIHPERLRDIGRVKLNCPKEIKDLAVMDLIFVKNPFSRDGQTITFIKYGPDVRIVIAGINRKTNSTALSRTEGSIEKGKEVVHKCLWEES